MVGEVGLHGLRVQRDVVMDNSLDKDIVTIRQRAVAAVRAVEFQDLQNLVTFAVVLVSVSAV